MLRTLEWTGNAARLLDQTRLPGEVAYLDITDEKQMHDAIRRLVVRGAPAIGVAAAFGAYLGVRGVVAKDSAELIDRLGVVCDDLATSRPTAVNLFWALDRMRRVAKASAALAAGDLKQRLLDECLVMIDEDVRVCRAIGENGVKAINSVRRRDPIRILTHCNAGSLATIGCGTALAPIYVGIEHGLKFHVFADETRPLLQGSRITAFELRHNGVPVTVLCDSAASTVMSRGLVDAVIVGADRVAANGDTANKVGTLSVAILAKHFGVPFFVAAPVSTIDARLADGRSIPIEHRSATEVSAGFGSQTAPRDVEILNPAFDVTPAELITGIITEIAVHRPPYRLAEVAPAASLP